MRFDMSNTVSISDEVLSQEVRGETVLLDLSSEQYFGLDKVGTRIWHLLREGRTLGDALETMLAEYEVDRKQIEADLDELLGDLIDAGLVSLESAKGIED